MGTFRWRFVMATAACLLVPFGGMGFGQVSKKSAEVQPRNETLLEQFDSIFETQEAKDIYAVLSSREVAVLYRIKALSNPCSREELKELRQCGSATVDEVRQVIDIAIAAQVAKDGERRAAVQEARSEEQNRYSRLFALGGLCISCLSLLLSALSYRQKKAAPG